MIPSVQLDLVAFPVPPGVEAESQSGLQLGNPKTCMGRWRIARVIARPQS